MRDHSEIEELLALEALGGIEPDDRDRLTRLLADHGPDCDECAKLQHAFGQVAAGLGAGLPAAEPGPELEERTMRAALGEPREPPSRERGWWVGVAAVAVAAVFVGAIAGSAIAPRTEDALSAFLDRSDVRVVALEPTGDAGGSVTMAVAGDEGFVIASDLPPLAEGQVYELWSITGTAPTSLSCFPTGAGAVVQPIAGPIEGADVAAVTVEDASCPSAPTTDPVFAATLA